jgi:hypothetical protein
MKEIEGPLIRIGTDISENKDFRGNEIHNPYDPTLIQAQQYMNYIRHTFDNISLDKVAQEPDTTMKILSATGLVNKAPSGITNTPAMKQIYSILNEYGRTVSTPEEVQQRTNLKNAVTDYSNGKINGSDVARMGKAGELNVDTFYKRLPQKAGGYPIWLLQGNSFTKNSYKDANGDRVFPLRLGVYRLMQPWEKNIFEQEYDPATGAKLGSSSSGGGGGGNSLGLSSGKSGSSIGNDW